MDNRQIASLEILLFNFQIEDCSQIRGEGIVPGIADVFFHIGEFSWFGILYLHKCGTIDDDFIPILALFTVLLDSDIILFSQRKSKIFAIVPVSNNSRTDMEKATFVYKNCRNPMAIDSFFCPIYHKINYIYPCMIWQFFHFDTKRNSVNLVPGRIWFPQKTFLYNPSIWI